MKGTIKILLVIGICDILNILFFIRVHEKITISDIFCMTSYVFIMHYVMFVIRVG